MVYALSPNDKKTMYERYTRFSKNKGRITPETLQKTKYEPLQFTSMEIIALHKFFEQGMSDEQEIEAKRLSPKALYRHVRSARNKLFDKRHEIYWRENIIKKYENAPIEEKTASDDFMDSLPAGAKKAIEEAGLTIPDLCNMTGDELEEINGIGPISAQIIVERCKEIV